MYKAIRKRIEENSVWPEYQFSIFQKALADAILDMIQLPDEADEENKRWVSKVQKILLIRNLQRRKGTSDTILAITALLFEQIYTHSTTQPFVVRLCVMDSMHGRPLAREVKKVLEAAKIKSTMTLTNSDTVKLAVEGGRCRMIITRHGATKHDHFLPDASPTAEVAADLIFVDNANFLLRENPEMMDALATTKIPCILSDCLWILDGPEPMMELFDIKLADGVSGAPGGVASICRVFGEPPGDPPTLTASMAALQINNDD